MPFLYKIHQSKIASSVSDNHQQESTMMTSDSMKNANSPRALILTPTPNMAKVMAEELETVAHSWTITNNNNNNSGMDSFSNIKITLATGGTAVFAQRRDLQNADIVVGTPTRILQFLRDESIRLDQMQHVILVEADQHVTSTESSSTLVHLARWLPPNRQTVVCSATFPQPVQFVTRELMGRTYYFVAGVGRVATPLHDIEQKVLYVRYNKLGDRQKVIADEIEWYQSKHPGRRILVFADDRTFCHRYGSHLKHIFPKQCQILTGGNSRREREKIAQGWLQNEFSVLVATDWIVQQLNLPPNAVGLVLQAEVPNNIDKYIYRVQLASQLGYSHIVHQENKNNDDNDSNGGMATAILDDKNVGISVHLVALLEATNQRVPAWLLGMSHIQRKRRSDLEEKITAGGGPLQKKEKTVDVEELFNKRYANKNPTEQASADRDLEIGDYTYDVKPLTILDTLRNMPKDDDDLDTDSIFEEDYGNQKTQTAVVTRRKPFVRQDPSKELLERYSYVTGTIKLSTRPNLDVIAALSLAAGVNPQIRFEYIGMFPYEVIGPLLKSRVELVEESLKRGTKKILIVAEKPWAARAIAEALSGSKGPRHRRGAAGNLPVYYFKTNRFKHVVHPITGNPSTVFCEVTSVDGHLFSLAFQDKTLEDTRRKDPINPAEFFRFSVIKKATKDTERLGVVEHLRSLAVGCSHLVLCMDNDDEGENIGHEIIAVTRKAFANQVAKERRQDPDAPVVRRVHSLKTPALSSGAIIAAFRKLEEPNPARARAFDARAEFDLRVGVAMTRLLTWKCIGVVKRNFSPLTRVMSYGTCHTPVLTSCVDRAREIMSFVPTPLARISMDAHFDDDPSSYKLRWIPDVSSSETPDITANFDEEAAKVVLEAASQPDSYLEVVEVAKISEQMKAPAALNTATLLSSCSRLFGISTKETLVMADRLYNDGFISFPRTETSWYGPDDFDVVDVLRSHQGHPGWGRSINSLLKTKYNVRSAGPPSDGRLPEAHPPIVCIKPATRKQVEKIGGEIAWLVYEFIVRYFLGTLSDDLFYTRTIAKLELKPGTGYTSNHKLNPNFELEQLSIESLGFALPCKWIFQDLGTKYSDFIIKKGMKMSIDNVKPEFRATKPPNFFQEHELIEKIYSERIGTDGSLALYIHSLVEHNYITIVDENGSPIVLPFTHHPGQERSRRRFLVPTSLGMALARLFRDTSADANDKESFSQLASVAARSVLETEFRQIAAGSLDKHESLERNLKLFQKRFESFKASITKSRLEEFEASLRPVEEDLRYWKELGAFRDQDVLETMKRESSLHSDQLVESA